MDTIVRHNDTDHASDYEERCEEQTNFRENCPLKGPFNNQFSRKLNLRPPLRG